MVEPKIESNGSDQVLVTWFVGQYGHICSKEHQHKVALSYCQELDSQYVILLLSTCMLKSVACMWASKTGFSLLSCSR